MADTIFLAFAKSHVRAYTRRGKDGQDVRVGDYDDSRQKRLAVALSDLPI